MWTAWTARGHGWTEVDKQGQARSPGTAYMTSKSVADFLAANGLAPDAVPRRKRGSTLDKVESEIRDLAAAGASINEMLKYLWFYHQMNPARSGFAAWLVRRGIGSSGRQLVPENRRSGARQSTASSVTRVDSDSVVGSRPAAERFGSIHSQGPSDSVEQPPAGMSRVKWRLEQQRNTQSARKSSTLPAALQFSAVLDANRKMGEAATAAGATTQPVDPVAALDRTPPVELESLKR